MIALNAYGLCVSDAWNAAKAEREAYEREALVVSRERASLS